MFFGCSVSSGLCDEQIAHSGDSYRRWLCVIVCDLETSNTRRPKPKLHLCATAKENKEKRVKAKFRIGALQHCSLKAYCAVTPKEFLHSSLEALHTERYTASQIAKEGTK
jgi:hypothetical protein